jgi:hypothetical protein
MPIRFVQIATRLMHASQGVETHCKDFLIPRLTGELDCLQSTSFLQETVLVRRFLVVSTRQMKETFTLVPLMPDGVCNLSHPLKICDRVIELS